ncbi:hypothetical protein DHEL01_v206047 [Diaporthe helianthi]|uniref:Uncharacterized protein n=1 Tax=Diaporthe helianthi TaxID=158607 RepID=A0A2P5HZ95_DIAHE|nr:hypothetical protein DHEL01_v206047 [Diaporthe helianthi]
MDSTTPGQPQEPSSQPPHPVCSRGIHILIGKVRRPQQQNSGAETVSYEAFQAAFSDQVNQTLAARPDKNAVTLFSPVGKYTLHYITPWRCTSRSGLFNPPLTSLMSLPSRRSRGPQRPVWVDFYIHSTPPPSGDPLARFQSEIMSRLRILDPQLGNGPGGHNTLGLAETPAGDASPTISLHDWACAIELFATCTTLNGIRAPGHKLLQDAVTLNGILGEDEPGLRRDNFEELLRYITENLRLSFVDDAVAARLKAALGRPVGMIPSRPCLVAPGFLEVMLAFLAKKCELMAADQRRMFLQDELASARDPWWIGEMED